MAAHGPVCRSTPAFPFNVGGPVVFAFAGPVSDVWATIGPGARAPARPTPRGRTRAGANLGRCCHRVGAVAPIRLAAAGRERLQGLAFKAFGIERGQRPPQPSDRHISGRGWLAQVGAALVWARGLYRIARASRRKGADCIYGRLRDTLAIGMAGQGARMSGHG